MSLLYYVFSFVQRKMSDSYFFLPLNKYIDVTLQKRQSVMTENGYA